MRTNGALFTAASAAVLGWVAVGAATCWVVLNPDIHYAPVSLLWIHSFAIVATISTLLLLALRVVNRMIGETKQAYALGIEHGVTIASAIGTPNVPGPEKQEAPAVAGAHR